MRVTSGIGLGFGRTLHGERGLVLHGISFGRIQEGPSTVCRTQRRRAGAVFGVNTACFFEIHKGVVSNERGESGCGIRRSRHGG